MKLGGNLDEISRFGMIDYFRDELVASDTILGAWDIYNDQYVLSLQQTKSGNFNTLSYDEQVQGWTSFYNYKPDQMFSIKITFIV